MAPQTPAAEVPLGGDDERLLIEAAKADPRCFGELYERHVDRVYAFVARRARDRTEAEDLTAEVFHHALAHLGRFEWRGIPFAAWLVQIARNAVADRWQRRARERERRLPIRPTTDARRTWTAELVLADLVRQLPGDQQRVVLERFVEDKSIREIAHELGRTEGAVKQLQFRALETLRARMRDCP